MSKVALLFGITGMDGSNLTDLLLEKDYIVWGAIRRSSYPNTHRIEHLMKKEETEDTFNLRYCDVIDFSSMYKLIKEANADEIYFLSAQSHVGISFDNPISTLQYNTMGYLNLLEIVRDMDNYNPKIYFAASSEMFGISPPPQNENTPFMPVSPYGCSKVCSFHLSRVYRHAYGMFICNGILFNHCHPKRGLNFVTKKISKNVAEIVVGKRKKITLGNLYSERDEGYSPEYVECMWKMLQQSKPDDYVISTGETHNIEDFVKATFELLDLDWKNYVEISDKFKRPFELPALQGDSTKARKLLGFNPKMKFKDIVKEMLEHDLKEQGIDSIEKAKEMIQWNNPVFNSREKELVCEVLESGFVSEGPKTKELEDKLSKIVGTKHIIMTTSCTSALYLAIEADKRIRNYTKGSVIIPALTFLATQNVVEMANLEPCIGDVDERFRYTLDYNPIETNNTKIIIPVNLLGRNCYIERDVISDDVTLIYDNAGSFGSNVPNGLVGCYSLQANKLISCGQGGFCATDSDEYAKEIRKLKDFGREDKYDNQSTGFNFKFNDILAAVTLGQLETLEKRKKRHLEIYYTYKKELSKYGDFIEYGEGEIPLWIEFEVKSRDNLFDYLGSKEIHCRKPWRPLKDLPNANYYADNFIWLPTSYSLSIKEQECVINEVKSFYDS